MKIESIKESPQYSELVEDVYHYFFRALMLPIPTKNEVIQTNKDGIILLVEELGLVVKIEQIKRMQAFSDDHPLKLAPLLELEKDDLRARVFPAVDVLKYKRFFGGGEKELTSLLLEEGFNFYDNQRQNVGVVRLGKLPWQRVRVVIDDDAVSKITTISRQISDATKQKGLAIQRKYSPLKKALTEAFAKGDFTDAYELCRKSVQRGDLICGWKKYRHAPQVDMGFRSDITYTNMKSKDALISATRYRKRVGDLVLKP